MNISSRIGTYGSILFILLLLTGCYLPKNFQIDLRVTRSGEYALRYQGEFIAVNLRKKIKEQGLSGEKLQKEIQIYTRDLTRDPSFSEVDYLKEGIFRVKYVYLSTIQRQPYYTFIRGDNKIITLTYHREKKLMTVTGGQLRGSQREMLLQQGGELKGTVRIITDLPILRHNAQEKLPSKTPSYVWTIESLASPTPSILIDMKDV